MRMAEILRQWPELLEEEDVADSGAQHDLARYLENLLSWLYRLQGWYVTGNVYILQKDDNPIAPDIFMCKIALSDTERAKVESWDLRQANRPAPAIVFEIASEATWEKDLGEKVNRYRAMGVEEYFTYDPSDPQVWSDKTTRLKGWRYEANKPPQAVLPDEQGRLWSNVLQRWLVADGSFLRFYDLNGQIEATPEEVAEAERLTKEKAWAKLRELGIDPEKL